MSFTAFHFFASCRRERLAFYAWLLIAFAGIGIAPSVAQTFDDVNAISGAMKVEKEEVESPKRADFILPLDGNRLLAVGDKLSFQIAEEPGEKSFITVSSSGEADFPYIGRTKVTGRTCKEVAGELSRRLEKSVYRKATVGLALETASTLPLGTYFVTGQVAKQGSQEIPRDREVTVAAAILAAGGFADFADRRRVRVMRPNPGGKTERFTVDVKAVLERGDVSKDIVVQPGDFIVVPERMFNF